MTQIMHSKETKMMSSSVPLEIANTTIGLKVDTRAKQFWMCITFTYTDTH